MRSASMQKTEIAMLSLNAVFLPESTMLAHECFKLTFRAAS